MPMIAALIAIAGVFAVSFGLTFAGLDEQTQLLLFQIFYWIHLGVVLVFLTELPGGKHFHVVTSVPAVFLRNLEPPGRLPPAPEFDGEAGVKAAEQFREALTPSTKMRILGKLRRARRRLRSAWPSPSEALNRR